jgi:hypothetical protein
MSDRLFMALIAAAAVVMIGFSAVWPQGLGARSPWPFGHTPVQQTPAMRAVMAREAARAVARNQAHVAAATAQLRRVSAPPAPAGPPAPASAGPDGLRPTQ